MKPHCVRWQCSPLSDTRSTHENPTTIMPGVNRSDSDLTHSSLPGKMHAPNLLRLNSIGEVSAESFRERAARKSKLGFSKSFDSISPAKSLPSTGNHRNNTMRSASFWEATFLPGRNDYHFSSPPGFSTAHHRNVPIVWQQASFQPGPGVSHWKENSSFNFSDCRNCISSPMYNSTMNYPYPHRIPGLLPGAMFTAMSAFPNNAKNSKMPQSQSQFQCIEKGLSGQAFTPQKADLSYFPAKALNTSKSLPTFSKKAAGPALKTTSADFVSAGSDKNCIVSSRDVEKHNSKKAQTDSVDIGSRQQVKKCVDVLQTCNNDGDFTANGKKCVVQARNSLKRRNEKVSESPESAGTSLNCSLTSVINDLSSVLSLRKTPKKGRPSCKKRKKRQHQRTSFTSQSQMNNSENVDSVTTPNQQCMSMSPIKIAVPTSSSSPSHVKTSIHPLSSSPSSSHPPPVTRLFCSPDSDSEWSDNEDIDDCDSLKLSCDYPKSLSPISGLGSALSFDSLFKPNNLPCLDKLLRSDNKSDAEPNPKSESSSSSSGSKKSLCFSLSFSVSEDEDSDRSFEFESLTASQSEQLILDFGFGNGLSLEAIIGKKADHFSCSSKDQLSDSSEVSQSAELDILLMKINAEWNKNYPSVGTTSSSDKGKVQFACEEDLVQTHIVGNEERRGTWCEDGQRFLKRIQDVEKVISYVFTDKHRQDIRQKLGLS